MSQFVLSSAGVEHAALVLRAHADVCLKEGFDYDTCVSGSSHEKHYVVGVVDCEVWFAIVVLSADFLVWPSFFDLVFSFSERVLVVIVERAQVAGLVCGFACGERFEGTIEVEIWVLELFQVLSGERFDARGHIVLRNAHDIRFEQVLASEFTIDLKAVLQI